MKMEVTLWIVVLILVALAFVFPKTRTISLSVVAVAIVAIVATVIIAQRGEPTRNGTTAIPMIVQKPVDFEQFRIEKLDRADPEAKSRIRVEEIRFDQIRAEAGAERGTVGTIVARLYNDSATYALSDYGYYLAVQDCIKSTCTSVFEQRGLASVSVPPRQARDVRIEIRDLTTRDVSPPKILGTVNILLTPTETRAVAANTARASD
jgi:hypothetical protein